MAATPATSSHDAATGLRDIKGLPEFSPFNFIPWLIAAGVIIVASLLYYKLRTRNVVTEPSQIPPISPLERALLEIDNLEQRRNANTISIRDFGFTLSQLLRRYLEDLLEFPAAEQTSREVSHSLRKALKDNAVTLSDTEIAKRCSFAHNTLSLCDRLEFAEMPENFATLESVQLREILLSTRQFILNISSAMEPTPTIQQENESVRQQSPETER